MEEELELTYLAKMLPNGLKKSPSKEMLDIYIPTKARHPNLRIRRTGDKYVITKKQPVKEGDASHMLETTIPLTKEEIKELSQLKGKRVEKTRYYYKEVSTSYEVDVFKGALKGLVLVDVEFISQEDKNTFKMPDWCLVDVTQEEFIAGGMLCGKKYKDIEAKLKKFKYKKL